MVTIERAVGPTSGHPGARLLRAGIAVVVGSGFLCAALAWSGRTGLFADAYSHVLYWHDLGRAEAPSITPTITTPKPLPVLLTGLAWDLGGGADGVRALWIVLAALLLGGAWLLGERLFGICGALLGTLLLARWLVVVPMAVEGRVELLAALGLLLALERIFATQRISAGAGLWLCLAGLVRPEPWVWALLLLAAAVIGRSWKAPESRFSLRAALVALAAPLLWLTWDLLVYGDAFHSRQVTAHWAAVLGPDVMEISTSQMVAGMAVWLQKAVERIGLGFLLAAVAGLGLVRARNLWGGGVLALLALVWVVTVAAYGPLRMTNSHRFIDPVYTALWPFAGGALAALLLLVPRQMVGVRVLLLAVMSALPLAAALGDLRDFRQTASRLEQPTRATIAALRDVARNEPELARGRWLVDNDIASRIVLETPLDRASVVTLQAASAEEIARGPWAGVVIDDRLQPRVRGTARGQALAALMAKGKVRYRAPACLVVTTGS
ncbi:MAG: hypothetical protein AB1486_13625 [Planctomycetota bacterium]